MTKQEYYDLLVRSASDDTFPSGDEGGCYYRLDDKVDSKQRCAVGLLIPDELYTPNMEGLNLVHQPIAYQALVRVPEGMDYDDLSKVQKAHDDCVVCWDAQRFIHDLNNLRCFQGVRKVNL